MRWKDQERESKKKSRKIHRPFSLLVAVMFYKVSTNVELANPESLFLRET